MNNKNIRPWNWLKNDRSTKRDLTNFFPQEMLNLMQELEAPFKNLDVKSFSPNLNIKETKTEYVVNLEIPGVKKEDVKIDIHDDTLFIHGEKRYEIKNEDDHYYHMESEYGRFERSLHLPVNADQEKVQASFEHGLLNIHIAKKEIEPTMKARKIDIR